MAMEGVELEHWREYFRKAKSDIFDIIKHAILVAALDCPTEFKLHRDQIAEHLFTCIYTRSTSGSDPVELVVLPDNAAGGSKESKTSNSRVDPSGNQFTSNFSYGEAEALSDEIEQQSLIVNEVLRIKDILLNSQDESHSALLESLTRLKLMALTVDILEATQIGKTVNRFRKHSSKQIHHLAQTLIVGWKELVNEWVSATQAVVNTNNTPESVKPSVVEEEEEEEGGLPSPPLDEGFFFTTQPTAMELSEFFDGMDDDGNLRINAECIENQDSGRKLSQENHNFSKPKQQTSSEAIMAIKDDRSQLMRSLEPFAKPNNKPSSTNMRFERAPADNMEQKPSSESKLLQKSDKMAVPKNPLSSRQDKFKTSDELSVQRKLEETKRKLQERYQQAENAKKKRTIQVVEFQGPLKPVSSNKNAGLKPGSRLRQLLNGRR